MTEQKPETYRLKLIVQKVEKVYKIERKLKKLINTVTKDYNHEASYYEDVNDIFYPTCIFVFHSQEVYERVKKMIETLIHLL